MNADVGSVLTDRLRRLLTEAGFSFDDPDPKLAWEVFKAFSREPLSANDDSISFGARRRGLAPRYKFGVEFARAFWAGGEGEGARDRLVLAFACEMPRHFTLKRLPTRLKVSDFSSLEDFFEAVERSHDFRLAATLSDWACEICLDSERW